MNESLDTIVNNAKERRAIPASFVALPEGGLAEMIYDPEQGRTQFAVARGDRVEYEDLLVLGEERVFRPYSPENSLIKNDIVLLPSQAEAYESEEALVAEIQAFIHRYVDLSPLFEQLSAYYVLFTWLYDSFNELPYLRAKGDTGSGKTRYLLTVGSLCYKPTFASGASTVSPLFRILDLFRGTLVIDEGDFRLSDEKAEVVKILNNGNARGFPVLRSEAVGREREFSPRAYQVYGPKLVATRTTFQDRALESRCLTEELGNRRLRADIPINLPMAFKIDARSLRNKLLTFRFVNYGRPFANPALVDPTIEPRLNQVFVPLLSVISDATAREDLNRVLHEYQRQLVADRGLEFEGQVVEVIREVHEGLDGAELSLRDITSRFIQHHAEEMDRKVTPKWIGGVIRRRLGLRTVRRGGTYVIPESERPKLEQLYEKYGLQGDPAAGEAF
ncbi:MAG TPA: hypothetical protein VNB06_15525 [Thermoanaerobaculia bacterium]|nr:hypothetical protein [Thermoanaerobaculia bacterium]